ncbi:Dirigent protein [Rhynchospora pubera]|uniref:Dirigent protein n=1 Tax=Rhynchospora pubera TaxID=906938 RepID=A0AAV8FJ83_9POAL|nr:Dirigent protein [Rhynchospora pubera]KAJ4814916.1 Dirigent protein [Rhynchospora pubera]
MAPSISQTALVSIILLLALHQACTDASGKKETHLHFFFHEILSGDDATLLQVVNPSNSSSLTFGTILVVDDMLKDGQNENSTLIGRAQGLNAVVGKADSAIGSMLNFVFTDGKYNGSTLAIYGRFNLGTVIERPVIGGTGLFRMATGYSLATPVITSATKFVYEFDVYVYHY